MPSPYDIVKKSWADVGKLSDLCRRDGVTFILSGENWIHDKGFFPALSKFVDCLGDKKWWLLNLDDSELFVEFNSGDSERDYFDKLMKAPDWQPGRPFPYAVRCQCFIGSGNWLLFSDRDAERMDLVMRGEVALKYIECAFELILGEGAAGIEPPINRAR